MSPRVPSLGIVWGVSSMLRWSVPVLLILLAFLAASHRVADAQTGLPNAFELRAEAERRLGATLESVAGGVPLVTGPSFPGASVLGGSIFSIPVGGAAVPRAIHAEVLHDVIIVLLPEWNVMQTFVGDPERWRVTHSQSIVIVQPGERGAQTNLSVVLSTGDVLQFDLIEVTPYAGVLRTGRVYVGSEPWLLDRVFSLLPGGVGPAILDSGVSVPDLLADPASVVYTFMYGRPGGLGSPRPATVRRPAPRPARLVSPSRPAAPVAPAPDPEPMDPDSALSPAGDPSGAESIDAGPPVPVDIVRGAGGPPVPPSAVSERSAGGAEGPAALRSSAPVNAMPPLSPVRTSGQGPAPPPGAGPAPPPLGGSGSGRPAPPSSGFVAPGSVSPPVPAPGSPARPGAGPQNDLVPFGSDSPFLDDPIFQLPVPGGAAPRPFEPSAAAPPRQPDSAASTGVDWSGYRGSVVADVQSSLRSSTADFEDSEPGSGLVVRVSLQGEVSGSSSPAAQRFPVAQPLGISSLFPQDVRESASAPDLFVSSGDLAALRVRRDGLRRQIADVRRSTGDQVAQAALGIDRDLEYLRTTYPSRVQMSFYWNPELPPLAPPFWLYGLWHDTDNTFIRLLAPDPVFRDEESGLGIEPVRMDTYLYRLAGIIENGSVTVPSGRGYVRAFWARFDETEGQ